MKTRNKTLLALASTVVLLSGCGGGGGDSGSSSAPETKTTQAPVIKHVSPSVDGASATKNTLTPIIRPITKTTLTPELRNKTPLPLPEAGLYEAALLKRDENNQFPIAIDGLHGLALIYPKNDTEQRWVVSVKGQDSATQWVGSAGQKVHMNGGIYPVSVTRTSDRAGYITPLTDSGHNIFLSDIRTNKGRSSAFVFSQGSESADDKALYSGWFGFVALNQVTGGTQSVEAGNWLTKDYQGFSNAMTGKVETELAVDGKLSVRIEMPAAGCTLIGQGGTPTNGLNKLTFNLKSPDKGICGFDIAKVEGLLEKQWTGALEKAGTVTAYVTTYTSAANQEQLVIGFPELDGLLITADKQ